MVKSMSLSVNRSELLVSCVSGAIYRSLTDDLACNLAAVSHTTGVTAISFSQSPTSSVSNSLFYFVTGTVSGEIRMWDLTDYACLSTAKFPKSGVDLFAVSYPYSATMNIWKVQILNKLINYLSTVALMNIVNHEIFTVLL